MVEVKEDEVNIHDKYCDDYNEENKDTEKSLTKTDLHYLTKEQVSFKKSSIGTNKSVISLYTSSKKHSYNYPQMTSFHYNSAEDDKM